MNWIAIQFIERIIAKQTAGHDVGLDIGEEFLHQLMSTDGFAELRPFARIDLRLVERFLRQVRRRQTAERAIAVPGDGQKTSRLVF